MYTPLNPSVNGRTGKGRKTAKWSLEEALHSGVVKQQFIWSSDPLCLQSLVNTSLRHNGVYVFACAIISGKSDWCLSWVFPSIPPGTEENRGATMVLCHGEKWPGEQHTGAGLLSSCTAPGKLEALCGRMNVLMSIFMWPFQGQAVQFTIDITSVLRGSSHSYIYPCYILAQDYICKSCTLFERLRIPNIFKYFKIFLIFSLRSNT